MTSGVTVTVRGRFPQNGQPDGFLRLKGGQHGRKIGFTADGFAGHGAQQVAFFEVRFPGWRIGINLDDFQSGRRGFQLEAEIEFRHGFGQHGHAYVVQGRLQRQLVRSFHVAPEPAFQVCPSQLAGRGYDVLVPVALAFGRKIPHKLPHEVVETACI